MGCLPPPFPTTWRRSSWHSWHRHREHPSPSTSNSRLFHAAITALVSLSIRSGGCGCSMAGTISRSPKASPIGSRHSKRRIAVIAGGLCRLNSSSASCSCHYGGAELETGLLSQPASAVTIGSRKTKGTMRFMGSFLQHIAIRSRQKAVQRGDDLRALADRRSDAFDRARADVADGEDARATCLQQAAIATSLRAGQHETFGVERYARTGEPIGVRIRTDEEEHVADRAPH